jgi:hypothetical protein
MTRSARLAAGLLVGAAFALFACGASSTPAPSSAPASGAPAPAEPTTPAAEATPAAPADDRPLEERLPTTYGGVTLQTMSLSGEAAIDKSTLPLLEKYGKTPADVSGASAFGGPDVIFIALRVKGLGEDALRELTVASAGLGVVDVQVAEVSLGGQAVYKTTVPGSENHGYFIVRGDTAFGVTTATDDVAARALAAIP